jgi:hypothetical protein
MIFLRIESLRESRGFIVGRLAKIRTFQISFCKIRAVKHSGDAHVVWSKVRPLEDGSAKVCLTEINSSHICTFEVSLVKIIIPKKGTVQIRIPQICTGQPRIGDATHSQTCTVKIRIAQIRGI